MPAVKALISPLAGQSFNPSAKAHKSVLQTVIQEERTEIEKNKKLSLKQQVFETKVDRDQSIEKLSSDSEHSELESDEEAEFEPKSFKPVDRLKKKTRKDLNKKIVNKAKEEVLQTMREEKNLDHQIEIMQTLIRQDENETKRLAKAESLRLKQEKEEKDR